MSVDFVSAEIARRYAHPGRTAYTYLFRLKPESDLGLMVPTTESVMAAWMDEGGGLQPAPVQTAIEHCKALYEARLNTSRPANSHERRRRMARSILFTVIQTSETAIMVHLLSRALAFSPKGDRDVIEEWRPTVTGWYSAYQPD